MAAIWIDAQLSPACAHWLPGLIGLPAIALRDLGLRDADDADIFQQAAKADAIVLTKDADFVLLQTRHGPPPRLIWLTCGNTSNSELRTVCERHAAALRAWLVDGSPLIEIH
jgi:predicted nuclease of predicted toxin-antitoxin system